MPINQKRMAADILKCGMSRVKVRDESAVAEALTREDVRELIKSGIVYKVQKKGTSRKFARINLSQKKKGRRDSYGSRKGTRGARSPTKRLWMKNIRALRKLIKEMIENDQIERAVYKELYKKVGGGMFRNRNHLLYYLKEHDLLKGPKPRKVKKEIKSKVKKKSKPVRNAKKIKKLAK